MTAPFDITVVDATIAAGQSLSGPVAIGPQTLVGIQMPATWTAAVLTFQVSLDGGATWQENYDANGEVTFQAAAGQYIAVDYAQWGGVAMLQVRSGTVGAPVNQTSAAVIGLVARTVA